MNTETLIILAVYTTIILAVFGFLALFYLHIKPFENFAPLIRGAFRGLLVILVVIMIFGFFQIISHSGKTFTDKDFDISVYPRLDF